MTRLRSVLLASAAVAAALWSAPCPARADVYMHNPAGSNNRNRERNENRNNANRLFDSQNNGKGGYPWRGDRELRNAPDPMVYFAGSLLRVEWTAQHSCGANPNAHCQMVVQYACEDTLPGLRDGYPSGILTDDYNDNVADYARAQFTRNNADGTNTIPDTAEGAADTEYGMHESREYYAACKTRSRNKGLYTADRQLNGNSARFTRQDPSGTRYAYECPEERDYYPYWAPAPWRDVAVLTSDPSWCEYYRARSQNVAPSSWCELATATEANPAPVSEQECRTRGGTWRTRAPLGGPPPECRVSGLSRDNHLGNAVPTAGAAAGTQPEADAYVWTIPAPPTNSPDGSLCVLRLRYNISTMDYPSMRGMSLDPTSTMFDSRFNCPSVIEGGRNPSGDENNVAAGANAAACTNDLRNGNRPLYNRPYVSMFSDPNLAKLSIAVNTDQTGRTFQDRSYVFRVKPRPANLPSDAVVWNLNTRGRRGNIVQCYPSVEYDFSPSNLQLNRGDYVHIQWTGSDFNTPRNPNDAEGWRFSDRFNMVQVSERGTQFPMHASEATLFPADLTRRLALLDQPSTMCATTTSTNCCRNFKAGDANEQDSILNCGKLNAAPAHMDFGIVQMNQAAGTYSYVSTRNNNFSNRSQKASITIVDPLSTGAIVGIVLGSAAVVAVIAGGLFILVKRGTIRLPSGMNGPRPASQKLDTPDKPQPAARRAAPPPPPPKPVAAASEIAASSGDESVSVSMVDVPLTRRPPPPPPPAQRRAAPTMI